MYSITKSNNNTCLIEFHPTSWENTSLAQFVIDLEAFRNLQTPDYMQPVIKDIELLGIALKSVGRYIESDDKVIVEFDIY